LPTAEILAAQVLGMVSTTAKGARLPVHNSTPHQLDMLGRDMQETVVSFATVAPVTLRVDPVYPPKVTRKRKLTATKSLAFKKVAEEIKIGRITHQKDPLVVAARNRLSLGTDDFRTEDREREVDLLLQILPDHSNILLLELDRDAFDSMEPKQITALFRLTARARGWFAKDLSRFWATYCKVLVWLYKNNYPIQPDGRVTAIYLILYFEEYQQGFLRRKEKQIQKLNSKPASSRAAQDGPLRNVLLPGPPDQQSVTDGVIPPTDHNGVSGLRSIRADMQPRTGVRTQKGTWSGHWGHRGLAWGQDNLKLPWNMANVPIESGVKGKRPDPDA